MLANMSPALFFEWRRDYEEEGWGDEWLQVSALATSIINEIRCQLCKDIKADDLLKIDALVEAVVRPREQTAKQPPSLESSLAAMRRLAGV